MLLQPLRWLFWIAARILMSLRYRVTVVGMEEALKKPGPYLLLPNHPGFVDPPNIFARLWPKFKMRPVANEVNFNNPVLGPLAALVRTIVTPDTDKASAEALRRAQEAVGQVAEALKQGDCVCLWASGRLMRDGTERLGGVRAVADILAAVPEATVVLVRTRGIWGSWFSWGYQGPLLPLLKMLWVGFLMLLSNLIFFMPRRKLTQTLEAFTAAERPAPTREAINAWLEKWYNADLPEKGNEDGQWPGEVPKYVPYHFAFGPRTIEFPRPHVDPELDLRAVKPEVKKAIAEILAEKIKRPLTEAENKAETQFLDLGIDSLDGMDITLQVETRFGFTGEQVPQSIGQLWALGGGVASRGEVKPAPPAWFNPPSDLGPVEVMGETVAEAFVNRCLKHPKDTAAADDIAGVQSYERLMLGAWLLAERFRQFPEPNIGLMLPASVAGDVTLLALHLAGKLPVILNWTTGPNNLEHAVKLMDLKRVITSKVFIDRTSLSVPGAEFVFLEVVRKTIGKFEAIRKLLQIRFLPSRAKSQSLKHAVTDPTRPAVVLFTSGSEKAPKAVPLTHANIVLNVRHAIPYLAIDRNDTLFGFLPLFHSFGHTVTGLFPIIAGIRVLHHPDPTDSGGLVRKIKAYKPTICCGTPTFMNFIFDKAEPGELDSLKIIVVGAEKCPASTFERGKQQAPNAVIMEGYGITECSPILAVNPTFKVKVGTLGLPIKGVFIRILDIENRDVLPANAMGLLEVSGHNVFPGYLGYDGPSPFTEADGKRWYATGDLAALDDDGYIVFHGRLKRFLKAGGEMISLPALEEPFAKLYPPDDLGPRVAVEGIETQDGRIVALFTRETITVRDANAILQREGFRGVMRLDEVRTVEKIPVLGTGKTDYKVLRAMLG